MAMNPMQRKANNYLLMGILGTLIVTGVIIGFLYMQLNKLKQENKARETTQKSVYVVTQDIKSGEAVEGNISIKEIEPAGLPSDALTGTAEITEKTIAKIDLKKGTVVTQSMVQESDEATTNGLRRQEYNVIILPSQIETGDYIDVRVRFSDGTDYIVASKKKVTIPEIEGVPSANTIQINMDESEMLVMSCAIIDAYQDLGSLLYATTYVDPGLQTSVTPTYAPSGLVQNEIRINPNIEQEAKNALISRYNNQIIASGTTARNAIESNISQYAQDKVDNIEAGVQKEITRAQEARESYLQSLGGE